MKKMRKAIALILAAAMLAAAVGCQKEITAENLMENIEQGNASDIALEEDFCRKYSSAAFTMLYNEYSPDHNVIISPLAGYYNMALLSSGVSDGNSEEFKKFFGKYYERNTLKDYMHSYADCLKNTDTSKLFFKNSMWFNSGKNVNPSDEFLSIAKTYYYEDAYKESFGSETVKNINNWSSNNTDLMADYVVKDIAADAPFYMVNATVLDADWEKPISPQNILDGRFTTSDAQEQSVQMMSCYESVFLGNSEFDGFIKNYAGGNYAFVALVPKSEKPDALGNYIGYFMNGSYYYELVKKRRNLFVDASIPKFTCEYNDSMKDNLHKMNLGMVFNNSFSLLAKVGTADDKLYLEDLRVYTALTVTEKGTRKGTGANVGDSSVVAGTIPVALNRPFIFAVVDTQNYLPVMLGVVNSVNS